MIELLGGSDRLTTTMVSWPDEAKSFFLVASEFISPHLEKGSHEDDLVSSLKEWHKSDKP